MGQMWAKNILFYPKAYSDEQMKDIPYPRVELYDHVVTKATQVNRVQRGLILSESKMGEEKTLRIE